MKRNWLGIICILVIIFLLSIPVLMRFDAFCSIVLFWIEPLGIGGKDIYMGILGNVLGTFIAIAGALWVQRKIDYRSDAQITKKSALIVYYDFYFVFKDLEKYCKVYHSNELYINNLKNTDKMEREKQRKAFFLKNRIDIPVHFDGDWIHTVADLKNGLSIDDIRLIYATYGYIEDIGKVLKMPEAELQNKDIKYMEKLFTSQLFNVTIAPTIEVKVRQEILDIINELSNISNKI